MKFFAAIIGFAAALGVQCGNPCRTIQKQDLIQSGTIELTNSATFKDNCFTVPINFQIPRTGLKTAVSTSNMEGFTTREGIDYSIRTRRKSNVNALSLYLASRDRQWKKITISYLATSRDDLHLGSFIADGFALLGCDASVSQTYEIRQQLALAPNGNYNALAYISGIQTTRQLLTTKFTNQAYDPKTSTLSIKLVTDTSTIENIHISYILYRPQVYDIKIFKPTDLVDLDYSLVAVYGFTKGKPVMEGFGLLLDRRQCLGGGCQSTCTSKKQCANMGGMLIDGACLVCSKLERIVDGKCVPNCGYGFQLDKGACVCATGFVAVGKNCLPRCPDNEIYNEYQKCECRQGCIRMGGTCRECPPNSQLLNSKCICNPDYKWDDIKYTCIKNPPPPILPPIFCPTRSTWNPKILTCECTFPEQHMINNNCIQCPEGESWNGSACVCPSGKFRINGVCRACDINSGYNGKDCVCNWGWFGNADKCQRCHVSCGKCTGPGANQCTACSEVALTLNNGYCYKDSTCPPGFYVNGTCKQCPSYCGSCKSEDWCTSCISGFELKQTTIQDGLSVSYCSEICGDGKRFQDDCDDNNILDGDGCSSTCKVEPGYTCSGATTVKKSTCAKISRPRTLITPTGAAQFSGKVVQAIRLTYLPPELTSNDCENCYKLLQVKVISSAVVPSVQLNFIPKSQYQFWCSFDFYGIFAIPVFKISIQINPEFTKYFSTEDMAQIQVKQIDPALLAKNDVVDTLSLDDIGGASPEIQEFVRNSG